MRPHDLLDSPQGGSSEKAKQEKLSVFDPLNDIAQFPGISPTEIEDTCHAACRHKILKTLHEIILQQLPFHGSYSLFL